MTDLQAAHEAYRREPGVCDWCSRGVTRFEGLEGRRRSYHWGIGTAETDCTAIDFHPWADQRDKALRRELAAAQSEIVILKAECAEKYQVIRSHKQWSERVMKLNGQLAAAQSTIEAQAREVERLKRESACPCCKEGTSQATGETCTECHGKGLAIIAYEVCRVHHKLQAREIGEMAKHRDSYSLALDVAARGLEKAEREIGELKAKYEPDCYCVCHCSVSSCPSCEHCKGINEVSDFHLRKEIGDLREGLKRAIIECREAAVLLSQVSPSSSITVKESDRLDLASRKMRSIERALLSSTGEPAEKPISPEQG